MADKAYEYMDWPRIEAIVYGEEASPRDVMQPRVTEDGVLIQGFFPGADAAEVVVGEKSYPMILEDEAGYYAVMLPLKRIPEYRFRVIRGSRKETAGATGHCEVSKGFTGVGVKRMPCWKRCSWMESRRRKKRKRLERYGCGFR